MGEGSWGIPWDFPQNSHRLPYVLLIAIHLVTLVPVDYPTFLSDIIPILGGQEELLDTVSSFEMDLGLHLIANFLKAFAKPLGIWDHQVNAPVVVLAIGWIVVMVVLGLINAVSIVDVGLESV